ncbi:MAG: M56 family metallopeptidase, partial [Planctomycetes bacterium]|nr:M56 family metallopeptidase [Planctomycetota bacterium]
MNVLEQFASQPLVLRLGWTLFHVFWQATLVALIVAVILKCIKKQAASMRYAIASLSLGLVVVLGAITFTQVSVSKPLPKAGYQPALSLVQAEMPLEAIKSSEIQSASAHRPPTFSWPMFRKRCISLAEPALPYVVVGWLVGVFGISLMHLGGWTQLRRIRQQLTQPISPALEQCALDLAQRLGIHKAFKIFESGLVQVPTAIGHLKPVILLPASALTGLSLDQIEVIIAHELAHIKRHDYLINLFQTAIETLGFYHPAIWWLSHTIRRERENCCDDMVVNAFNNPVQYAKALTNMAKIRTRQIDMAMAANGSSLVQRIERLVSVDKQAHRRPAWLAAILSVILIAAIAIPTTVGFAAKDRRHRPASDDVTARFNEWINAIVDNDTRAFEMIAHNMCVNRSPDANEAAATESLQKQAQRLRVYAGLDHLKIISMENKGDHFDVLTSPVKDPGGVSGRFLITIPTKVKPYYPNGVIRFITKTGTSYSVPQTILTKVYYLIAPDNFPLIEQLPDSLGYISPSALMAFKDAFKELPNAKILSAPQVINYSGELATISIQGESYTYETSVLSTVQRDRTTIVVDYEYELLLEGEQYKGRNQIALPSEYATYTKAHTFSA